MKLYLMRHGQAESPQIDPAQGLTAEGRADVEQLAKRLATKGIRFDQVLHSDKARAQQTATIMAAQIPTIHAPNLRSGLKPNDDPRPLLAEIEAWSDDTLIVSHLPFVPGLIALLTGDTALMAMIPATIVCLSKEGNQWRIEWVETP